MRSPVHLIAVLGTVLFAGCSSNDAATPPTVTSQQVSTIDLNDVSVIVTVYPVETTAPFQTPFPIVTQSFDPTLDRIVSQVKFDLVQKTGVSREKISVLAAEAVEWPDSSLGCGKPGTEYPQVVTPGFQITLEADGKIYSYHTSTTNQIILCDQQLPVSISPTP